VTCDKDDIGSYKTIQANGRILKNEVEDKVWLRKCGVIQRYWIYL
jgi:predicted acetyltransferase